MSLPDLINGGFEVFGFVAMANNIRGLLKDKMVRGFRLTSMLFFTSWGIWNVYYYPHLQQWASFVGGLLMCLSNIVYVSLTIYYLRKNNELGSLSHVA